MVFTFHFTQKKKGRENNEFSALNPNSTTREEKEIKINSLLWLRSTREKLTCQNRFLPKKNLPKSIINGFNVPTSVKKLKIETSIFSHSKVFQL